MFNLFKEELSEEEKRELAEKYCRKNHLVLIFCNKKTFAYADITGTWWQMPYSEIE